MSTLINVNRPRIRLGNLSKDWLLNTATQALDAFVCSQMGLGPGYLLGFLLPYRTQILRSVAALRQGYVTYQIEIAPLV